MNDKLVNIFYTDSKLVDLISKCNESLVLDFIGMNLREDNSMEVDVYLRAAMDYVRNRYLYQLDNRKLEIITTEFVYPNNKSKRNNYTEMIEG